MSLSSAQLGFIVDLLEVLTVGRCGGFTDDLSHMGTVDKAASQGYLLQAGYFQPLTGFDDLNIIAGLQQTLVGSGIKPGDTATQSLDR